MIHLRLSEGSQTVLERPLSLAAVEVVAAPLGAWAKLARSRGRVPRAMLICGDVIRIIRLPPAAGE
jgi:hypothetical protein